MYQKFGKYYNEFLVNEETNANFESKKKKKKKIEVCEKDNRKQSMLAGHCTPIRYSE